ncbi:actin-like ATPase domain-containing protein [Teratosphaeria nubilosa]|uniref:Actin-like ATPase domain-containing protein n=1 Tax=Teratosphaeria nubilosa TaxID=161662 RepID=A0A6G1L0A5_9PEZI|nr:actin-like ATPase domain-containing protein [Teratosphaeria nubilosa]
MFLTLILLFTTTASAASSVLGIDFGTQNFKAALVKPGIPLEIVLTKDSKRKEAAAVAFKPNRDAKNNIVAEVGVYPERAYGGDALALQGRFPGEVFPNLKPLLGLPYTDGANAFVKEYKGRYPAVQASQDHELGTVVINSAAFAKEEKPWSVEELLAMELANVRRNAETMAGKGTAVQDAVITVPAFYTADERRAIEKAAQLAGFEVNALITDGLAVGLDYAKSRTFPDVTKGEKPEIHLVYDMGAGSTTATVLRFQGKSVKDVGRFNKTVQEVAVLGTGWDRQVGGDSLTQLIVDDYVHKFSTKPVMKSRSIGVDEIKKNGRAMSRIWKDAEKARQVLSANSETTSSFEELLPEIDFKTKLSRADFEELVGSWVERVAAPMKDALAQAGLQMSDIDSVILHGGATRTPFVQRKLEEVAGSAKLRSNVNADESAVFGAAFKGAGLSPSFKVKEIRDSDIAGYAAGMTYKDGGKNRKQQLFSATSAVGQYAATKQVTFKDKDDFAFGLYQVVDEADRPVARIETSNLTDSVKELHSKFGCEKDDISTKFSIKLSPIDGLPEVVGGAVSCEVEGSGKSATVGDTVKDWLGFGGKKDQEPLKEGAEGEGPVEEVNAESSATSADDADATSESAAASTSKVPEKPKKRTESIVIAFTTAVEGNSQPAPEEMKRMKNRLAAFDKSDRARAAREEALNNLESYTYFVRDFLTNDDYTSVSTQAVRDEISKLLESTRSFMEDPSQIAKATEASLKEMLTGLKKLVEPIQSRRKEALARPDKIKALQSSLEQTEKFLTTIREQVASASAAQVSASAYEASAGSASTTAKPETDEWADLEEPDATMSSEMPKYSSPSDFSPYTEVDLKDLESTYESTISWLKEKEAEQNSLKETDEPAFTVKDVELKAAKLSQAMAELVYKKIRQEKPKAKKGKSSSSSKSKGKKAKATGTAAAKEEKTQEAERSEKGKGNSKFMTAGPDDEMPSEEQIEAMIREGNKAREDEL